MTCEYDVKEEGRHFWQVQERAGFAMAEDQSKENPDVYLVDSPRVAAGFQGKNVEVECAENMELWSCSQFSIGYIWHDCI